MPRVLLVRHAPSAWNELGRWQGWADPPLSARGEHLASAASACLAVVLAAGGSSLAGVVSSDLRRASCTARLLTAGTGVPVVTDPGLREYEAGHWTGLTRAEIDRRWPGALAHWDAGTLLRAPGGEDPHLFVARLAGALGRAAAAAGAAGDVLVVSHGRAIHAAVTALGAPGSHIANLAGWVLGVGDGRLRPLGPLTLSPRPGDRRAEGLPSGG